MDATLGFILIFVLAVVLIAVGLGLSRRSRRGEAAPGERPPSRPASPTATLPPPIEVEAPEVIAPEAPALRERLGKTRAAFAKLRGRGRIDDETWEELEDTLLLADVGMPVTERILGDVRDRAASRKRPTPMR